MAYTTLDILRFVLSSILILYIAKKICNVFYIFLIGPLINKVDIKSCGQWAWRISEHDYFLVSRSRIINCKEKKYTEKNAFPNPNFTADTVGICRKPRRIYLIDILFIISVVTGSSDGIGKAFAKKLAERGCDIILVGNILNELMDVAAEIGKKYSVQTKVIHIDFSESTSIYDKFAQEIDGLEIGVLVNNVGIAYPYPEYFLNLKKELITKIINVNVVTMIRVTHLVLPEMVKRGKGIIINLGSSSYYNPNPMLSVYAASKAFAVKFSDGIRNEYSNQGILVQCICPGFVKTNLSKLKNTNAFVLLPDKYVEKALRLLGTTPETHGCFTHALITFGYTSIGDVSEKFMVWLTIKILEYNGKVLSKQYNKQ